MKAEADLVASIDVSKCPKDFRLAWFDLETSMRKAAKPNTEGFTALLEGTGALLAGPVGTGLALEKGAEVLKSGQQYQEVQDAVQDAIRNVKRAAIAHGLILN